MIVSKEMWSPVDWDNPPIGKVIARNYNSEPDVGWFNKSLRIVLTSHQVIENQRRLRYAVESVPGSNYSFIAHVMDPFIYLVEPEPYDPLQEPEDDCL